MKKQNLIGLKFGRLTVVAEALPKVGRKIKWNCICECGNSMQCTGENLRGGHTNSCGCLNRDVAIFRNTIHGHAKTRTGQISSEYNVWRGMKDRCLNPQSTYYNNYGGRGIEVCERWRNSFQLFLKDMGLKPQPRLTIERIDNSKGYQPDNCKWATYTEQQNNRRNNHLIEFRGLTHTIAEWGRLLGIHPRRISVQLNRGWSAEDALSKPLRYIKKK